MKRIINKILGLTGYELRHKSAFPDPMEAQRKLVKSDNITIFDVGAHQGKTSAAYLEYFKDARLIAFEPSKESFRELKRNLEKTEATCHNVAIGDYEGEITLNTNTESQTNSILKTSPEAEENWGPYMRTKYTYEVKMTTIDKFCQEFNINIIDILKLDIQGAEMKALKGAQKMLNEGRIGLVYMEIIFVKTYVGQSRLSECLVLLENYGYELHGLYDICRKNGRVTQCDAIFKQTK